MAQPNFSFICDLTNAIIEAILKPLWLEDTMTGDKGGVLYCGNKSNCASNTQHASADLFSICTI